MGREIRMVPPNWEHPKDERGRLRPMFDKAYEDAAAEWVDEFLKWHVAKEYPSYADAEDQRLFYWEWNGNPPDKAYYRPWKTEATWFQVWETASEGTPVSPPFATKDELIAYLADHGDFWDQKRGDAPWGVARATAFVNSGWAPTGVVINGKFHEGTSLAALTPNPPTPAPPAES